MYGTVVCQDESNVYSVTCHKKFTSAKVITYILVVEDSLHS